MHTHVESDHDEDEAPVPVIDAPPIFDDANPGPVVASPQPVRRHAAPAPPSRHVEIQPDLPPLPDDPPPGPPDLGPVRLDDPAPTPPGEIPRNILPPARGSQQDSSRTGAVPTRMAGRLSDFIRVR